MFPSRRITSCSGDKFRDEYSLAFDGSDDHIKIPSIVDSVHDANFSYLFWAKRNVTDAIHNILGDTASGTNYIRFSTTGLLSIETNSSGDQADGTLVSNDTGWHYYAVVISGGNGTCQMYQDGVALSMTNPDLEADLKYRRIGGQGSEGTSSSFNGNISEIAVYNIALTSSQVATIYNGREPYNHKEGIATSNLQAWWRMGDGGLDSLSVIGDEVNSTRQSNLLANPTFDTNYAGWESYTGTSENNVLSQETTIVHSGGGSLKVVFCDDNDQWAGRTTATLTAVANKVLLLEGWVYIPSGSYNGGDVDLTDGSGLTGASTEVKIKASASITDTWQFMRTLAIPVSGDVSFQMYLHISDTAPSENDILYYDDISVRVINGNAGIMTNMSADDFVGDTP